MTLVAPADPGTHVVHGYSSNFSCVIVLVSVFVLL
jgi:hypothetical protein